MLIRRDCDQISYQVFVKYSKMSKINNIVKYHVKKNMI